MITETAATAPSSQPHAAIASSVEPLDLHHRRRAVQRRPRRRLARRRAVRRDPGAAAQAQGAVPARPGHHARRARRVRAPLRRARGPSGRRQRSRPSRAWCASTRSPTRRNDHYENAWHCDATWREKPAVGLRAALRRMPAGRRRHDVGEHGRGLRTACRSTSRRRSPDLRARHSIEATFGAAMPIEKRLALKAQFPDAEHPVVRTHPETGEKVLFVNASPRTSRTSTRRRTCASARTATRARASLLNYLISQAYIPEYRCAGAGSKNSVAIWDNRCTQHYAVQDFWPAVRKMERAGNHRRAARSERIDTRSRERRYDTSNHGNAGHRSLARINQGRAADLHDRRRAFQRQSRRRLARRRARRGNPRAAAQAQGAVLPRPGHHARRARRVRAALRRARGSSGRRQRSREPRASCASTSRPTARTTATRTPGTPTPRGARSRRSAACCAASNARRSAATRCGSTWSRRTTGCRSTSRRRSPACARATASRRASAPRCRSRSGLR